jgi:uncharacterized protein (TIGR00251 family)
MTITVHVTPNASRSEVVSRGSGPWKIRLTASPVDGKANEALIRLLADEFDCAPSLIRIVKGGTAKMKTVEIEQ